MRVIPVPSTSTISHLYRSTASQPAVLTTHLQAEAVDRYSGVETTPRIVHVRTFTPSKHIRYFAAARLSRYAKKIHDYLTMTQVRVAGGDVLLLLLLVLVRNTSCGGIGIQSAEI